MEEIRKLSANIRKNISNGVTNVASIAFKAKVSRQAVYNWLNNNKFPAHMKVHLAEILGSSIEKIEEYEATWVSDKGENDEGHSAEGAIRELLRLFPQHPENHADIVQKNVATLLTREETVGLIAVCPYFTPDWLIASRQPALCNAAYDGIAANGLKVAMIMPDSDSKAGGYIDTLQNSQAVNMRLVAKDFADNMPPNTGNACFQTFESSSFEICPIHCVMYILLIMEDADVEYICIQQSQSYNGKYIVSNRSRQLDNFVRVFLDSVFLPHARAQATGINDRDRYDFCRRILATYHSSI